MKKEKKTLTIQDTVLEDVDQRYADTTIWNRSSVVSRDLARYYYVIEEALKATEISVEEACALIDVLNGMIMYPPAENVRMLWAEIEDADQYEGIGVKWGIDAAAFVARLKGMSPPQLAALVDAAERFWAWEGHSEADLKEAAKRFFAIGALDCESVEGDKGPDRKLDKDLANRHRRRT